MRRRRLLGSFAGFCTVLTAGCLDETDPDSAEPTSSETATTAGPTTTESATDATTEPPTTEVPPDTDALTASSTILRSAAADSPPRVAVEVTNTADIDVRLSGGATLPFTSYWAEDGPLVALPDDTEYVGGATMPDERTDGCWRADSKIKVAAIGLMEMLPAGASVSTNFTVVTGVDADECAVGDEFTFENQLSVDAEHWSTGYGVDVELTVARDEAGDVTSASATVRTKE